MSERLNLSDLDQLAKYANKREVNDTSKRALDSLKSQISVLKTDHGIIDKVEWKNATQVLRNIMVEILTSNEWLTIKQGDQLSYINGLLPKWYRIDFNKEANLVKVWDKVRVVVREGTVKLISPWSWEEKDIWALSQWPNIQEPDNKEIIPSIETTEPQKSSDAKDVVEVPLKKIDLPYSINENGEIIYEKDNTRLLSSVREIFSKIRRDKLNQSNTQINNDNSLITVKESVDILNWKDIIMPKWQIYSLVLYNAEFNEVIKKFPDYKEWDLVIKEVKWDKIRYLVSSKTAIWWWNSALISN